MKKGHAKKPEDSGNPPLINRTGAKASPIDSAAQAEAAEELTRGAKPNGHELAAVRADYEKDAHPIGTMPPPTTARGVGKQVKGVITRTKPNLVIDKLAERCAFERTGTRLYEGVIAKLEARGTFQGGPSREQLVHIHGEELAHFKMLAKTIEELGADPTAMTPCADVTSVASSGLVQVIADPRTTLAQALQAILIAELADGDGWQMLIELCEDAGEDDLAEQFEDALREETEHLAMVRSWLSAYNEAAVSRVDTEPERASAQK